MGLACSFSNLILCFAFCLGVAHAPARFDQKPQYFKHNSLLGSQYVNQALVTIESFLGPALPGGYAMPPEVLLPEEAENEDWSSFQKCLASYRVWQSFAIPQDKAEV